MQGSLIFLEEQCKPLPELRYLPGAFVQLLAAPSHHRYHVDIFCWTRAEGAQPWYWLWHHCWDWCGLQRGYDPDDKVPEPLFRLFDQAIGRVQHCVSKCQTWSHRRRHRFRLDMVRYLTHQFHFCIHFRHLRSNVVRCPGLIAGHHVRHALASGEKRCTRGSYLSGDRSRSPWPRLVGYCITPQTIH